MAMMSMTWGKDSPICPILGDGQQCCRATYGPDLNHRIMAATWYGAGGRTYMICVR